MPLHPLLVAAYPVVFLFAQNIDQQISLAPLWRPLLLALGLALLLWGPFTLLCGDARRGALAATFLLALFFSFGHLYQAVGAPDGWAAIPQLALWLMLATSAVVLAGRGGRWVGTATAILNVATAVAVGISAATIGAHMASAYAPLEARGLAGGAADEPPDIYYIVPDRYASAHVLKSHYDFDNSAFLDALAERGFYVAPHSYANYPRTGPSLLSTLSIEYLDHDALQREQSAPGDESPINRRLAGSLPVPSFLKQAGYHYIHIGNVWEPTSTNADADVVLTAAEGIEFAAILARTTLLAPFLSQPQDPENPWDDAVVRAQTLRSLDALEQTADGRRPRFVFAHLLLPHAPYVFNADGSLTTQEERERRGETGNYLEQLQYANSRFLALIDRLQAAPDQPVIIIQADEGPWPQRFREEGAGFDWTTASDEELDEKFGILSAYYLPGIDAAEAGLHPEVTPVNTFRAVFNAYFDTGLPLHPDRSFAHTSYRQFLDFFEVTERLGQDR